MFKFADEQVVLISGNGETANMSEVSSLLDSCKPKNLTVLTTNKLIENLLWRRKITWTINNTRLQDEDIWIFPGGDFPGGAFLSCNRGTTQLFWRKAQQRHYFLRQLQKCVVLLPCGSGGHPYLCNEEERQLDKVMHIPHRKSLGVISHHGRKSTRPDYKEQIWKDHQTF